MPTEETLEADPAARSAVLPVAEVIEIVREWVDFHARHMPCHHSNEGFYPSSNAGHDVVAAADAAVTAAGCCAPHISHCSALFLPRFCRQCMIRFHCLSPHSTERGAATKVAAPLFIEAIFAAGATVSNAPMACRAGSGCTEAHEDASHRPPFNLSRFSPVPLANAGYDSAKGTPSSGKCECSCTQ